MGKFSDIAMIGALAGGGYLVYRFVTGGFIGDIFGGIGGGISDFFGGITRSFSGLFGGGSGNGAEAPLFDGKEIYVGGERAETPYVPIFEQRELWKEDLPELDPLIDKVQQSFINISSMLPAYVQRQMARGMALEHAYANVFDIPTTLTSNVAAVTGDARPAEGYRGTPFAEFTPEQRAAYAAGVR